ncbi:hypothetical protein APHAL10511_008073 [Amanita phalloides]|nr:hypothetical protein APHAL10511_008073 [Amanita phalloides]
MLPDPQDSYGLDYSQHFLSSLLLVPRSNPAHPSPVRLLSAKSFGDLHLHHVLSHPPDNVLFPFLHGLEGDNHAQNAFFHSSAIGAPTKSYGSPATVNLNYAAKVPKYRGLVWVVCEEDLQLDGNDAALCVLRRRPPSESDSENESEDYSETSSSFDDDEEVPDEEIPDSRNKDLDAQYTPVVVSTHQISLDDTVGDEPDHQVIPLEQNMDLSEGKHMHPIQHRPTIKTTGLMISQPISISSSVPVSTISTESDDNTSSSSSSVSGTSYFTSSSTSTMTSVDSVNCSPQSESPPCSDSTSDLSNEPAAVTQTSDSPVEHQNTSPSPKHQPSTFSPPLLTSTFRPKELLRKIETDCPSKSRSERKDTDGSAKSGSDSDASESESEWEFVPARVPDGISLRNFSIQVPVYATLSDIVVYSPKGPTKRALALAERFRIAIERKRKERIQKHVAARLVAERPAMRHLTSFYGENAMGYSTTRSGDGPMADVEIASRAAKIEQELEKELLRYNVFVLSANEKEMRRDIPHLVMRVATNPEWSASAGWETEDVRGGRIPLSGGAHTDRSDGHVVEQGECTDLEPYPRATSSQAGDMGMELDMEMDVDTPPVNAKDVDDPENDHAANTVDFAQREKDEMRDLTRASEILSCLPEGEDDLARDLSGTRTARHWDPLVGQVFLGNANDVPLVPEQPIRLAHVPQASAPASRDNVDTSVENGVKEKENDLFDYRPNNDPQSGYGYDICVECHDLAPFPTAAHLRAAEDHLTMLDKLWAERCKRTLSSLNTQREEQHEFMLPPRPPPSANAVLHLPCPSSPTNSQSAMASLLLLIKFLEKYIRPVERATYLYESGAASTSQKQEPASTSPSGRRWSSAGSPSSLFSGFTYAVRTRSFTTPHPSSPYSTNQSQDIRSRPLKVLIYSADGYTESSVLALCLLLAVRGLSLPEVYLELQTLKRRSFFVYQSDLGLLKRVESRLREDREREHMQRQREMVQRRPDGEQERWATNSGTYGWGVGWYMSDIAAAGIRYATGSSTQHHGHQHGHPHVGRPAAKSVSFAQSSLEQYRRVSSIDDCHAAASVPPMYIATPHSSSGSGSPSDDNPRSLRKGRPRANTSPWLPSLVRDHHSWFNDPRFDGSFPSRVLPFLYLGNLNHALNAYMLHALGITHVVSVGECALVPPPHATSGAHSVVGRGPGGHGSLWMEEREGRIKVLDIKGVCDDGIDTLEPQLEPICDWIDKARQEGGKVLVHCRVGVSRSATVTIAYVMKHLSISLVDAYLIVRSRRLSVLIQPNMRLLYNLCAWEIKLAEEHARGDEQKLKRALARTLSWPYLAKEVHALNEKYLR